MKIFLHIGLPGCGAERLQATLDAKREQLRRRGVLFAETPGRRNHTRLFMAVSNPQNVDPLRLARGYADPAAQELLLSQVLADLRREVAAAGPETLILSAHQFSQSLAARQELSRLRAVLSELSDDIRIVAHVDEQARVLARYYDEQIMGGRTAGLDQEIRLAQKASDWRKAALAAWPERDPDRNQMPEIHAPPFWLDYGALVAAWEDVFGKGRVALRPYRPDLFASPVLASEIVEAFEIDGQIGKAEQAAAPERPSAVTLARARAMNMLFTRALETGRLIPRQMWRRMLGQLAMPGAPTAPGSLAPVSAHFARSNKKLFRQFNVLKDALQPDPPLADWHEPDPQNGFRASQYMTVFLPLIDKATQDELKKRKSRARAAANAKQRADAPGMPKTNGEANGTAAPGLQLSDSAKELLPPLALMNLEKLPTTRFAPHNRLGRVNEEELAAPYAEVPARALPEGNSGNVIVACMKNEGPYIVEWVAYHRAIGVDNFLIYTNGCEDGTDAILDRMQALGLVQHRNNDQWKGKSPQQHALNRSLKEPVVQNAEWVIHIDVDEFINVRCGNGTLADLFERVPDATNIAMTWRLFGNAGVEKFEDRPVIEQFDRCAPKYCPKPHTVWGFKTMMKNIGAYAKLSCHRPNKLDPASRDRVKWVNGSGQDMGEPIKERGWRSEVKSIGYDLVQLNHYALRSAESFLVKRQRGRALHVDRSIGLNYWLRMDWSDHRDVTIQRNLPRLKAEMARLLEDAELARLHKAAVKWHRAKAAELHAVPEFEELYRQAQSVRLTELERVAYVLAHDMES